MLRTDPDQVDLRCGFKVCVNLPQLHACVCISCIHYCVLYCGARKACMQLAAAAIICLVLIKQLMAIFNMQLCAVPSSRMHAVLSHSA